MEIDIDAEMFALFESSRRAQSAFKAVAERVIYLERKMIEKDDLIRTLTAQQAVPTNPAPSKSLPLDEAKAAKLANFEKQSPIPKE